MVQATLAAELFATTGAARATVVERRQDGAGARRLRRHLLRAEEQATGPRGRGANEAGDPVAIVGIGGADQAALATGDEGGGKCGAAVVAADGGDRAEHFVLVERGAVHRRLRRAHDRADEEALAGGNAGRRHVTGAAVHAVGRGGEARDTGADIVALCGGGEWSHADAFERWITDRDRCDSFLHRVADLGELVGGNEHTADRGALLAGLLGHVA